MLQCLNTLRGSALRLAGAGPIQLHFNVLLSRSNQKSTYRYTPQVDKKPCFNLRNVSLKRADGSHAMLVSSFLKTHYWPREPSIMGLYMPLDSEYLEFLSAKYGNMGERLLAMECLPRTKEHKMIGLTVADRVYPWMISELEQWGHVTEEKPERHHMYFCAHLLKSPNLFKKYKVEYIYNIHILCTAEEVTGQGVGTYLLKNTIESAYQGRHPLIQVVSLGSYSDKICERCGMSQVWNMDYKDFVDLCGRSVFYPRRPHLSVAIYVKHFDPKLGGQLPCKPAF